jgi:hypothetical protein
MFDQILAMVKDHLGNNPQVSSAIPAEQQDAVHREVASQLTENIKSQAGLFGGAGGFLSALEGRLASGGPIVNAIEGGVVGSLGSKFGLSPAITGAIAASLPGLLQKFLNRANDPHDTGITQESINQSIVPGPAAAGLTGTIANLN